MQRSSCQLWSAGSCCCRRRCSTSAAAPFRSSCSPRTSCSGAKPAISTNPQPASRCFTPGPFRSRSRTCLVIPATLLWLLVSEVRERKSTHRHRARRHRRPVALRSPAGRRSMLPSAAFYLAPGRAWEFLTRLVPFCSSSGGQAAARSCALSQLSLAPCRSSPRRCSSDARHHYPGAAALLPCPCPWGGAHHVGEHAAGDLARLRRSFEAGAFIGRISYSLYLWHWPAYVLARAWTQADEDLTAAGKSASGDRHARPTCHSLSYAAIELRPLRTRRRLHDNRLFVAACGGVGLGFRRAGRGSTFLPGAHRSLRRRSQPDRRPMGRAIFTRR